MLSVAVAVAVSVAVVAHRSPVLLRMYGQTNCFVLPEGQYGAFEFKNNEVLIVSERAALGLAHQDMALEWGKVRCLLPLTGSDLLGLALKAPNSVYERVYTLPLMTISMGKGTGVVTSVPSDAPDDYIALKELKDKPLWREKFGLTAEMVDPFEVIPIIDIPGYGSTSAVVMCERLDIKSSKDATNIETRIERDGDDYVINGRKWWSSGVGDPRCKVAIVMGKTDPTNASRHAQQSQILVPMDSPGVEDLR
eukprot:gene14313-18953_t